MHTARSLLVAALLVTSVPAAALAHAKMTASVPKDGATVSAGLTEIALSFSKPLRLTLVHVVRTTEQKEVALTNNLSKSFADSARITVDPLPAGPYEVSWTAVADDGHVMSGSFKFSVSEGQGAQPGP